MSEKELMLWMLLETLQRKLKLLNTSAIGKGFAIGSAALVSFSLFGAFYTRSRLYTALHPDLQQIGVVDVLNPFVFSGLMIGAMLPYWFSALTMKSVGKAALQMVEEVRR